MSVLQLAFKNALANRSRFALTGLAVALSVAFLTATLTLSDSMTGTAAKDIANASANIDAVVEGATIAEGGGGPGELEPATRETIAPGTVAAIDATDGVAETAPIVAGFAKLVDGGQAVGTGFSTDVGTNWVDSPALNPFTVVDGAAPSSIDEVAIDRAAANDAGVVVGSRLDVVTATGVRDVSVVGIVAYGAADGPPGQRVTFFADDVAADVLDERGVSEIRIAFEPGSDPVRVLDDLAAASPDAAVVSGPEYIAAQQDEVTSPLAFLGIFLLAFAAIATVVGITIIYNTFAIAIAQRRRELALLRAVGAERRQVMWSVMAEATLIGTVATVVGIGFGIVGVGVLRAIMTALGLTFLASPTVVTVTTLAIASAVGLLVTLASAWAPARTAASAAPIEALRESATETTKGSPIRATSGVICLGLGLAGLIAAVALSSPLLLAVGGLLIPGLVLGGPTLVHGAVNIGRPVLARFAGVEGAIAATNLHRNPRRASSTSLALTLGVALVSFFTILASTLSASVTNDLSAAVVADQVITSVSPDFATIDPALGDRLSAIDGVNSVAAVAQAEAAADGAEATVAGIDPVAMQQVFGFAVIAGQLDDLAAGGVAVVDTPTSPAIGDTVTLRFEDSSREVNVVAQVANSLGGFDAATHFVSAETLGALQGGLLDNVLFVSTDDASAVDRVRAEVAETPGSLLESRASYLANAGSEVDAFRNFIYAMLGLTVVIALVGIANTTTLSTRERLREIGLLRAVGTTSTGIRRIIRYEAALLAIAGTIIGLGIALGGGWALISATGGTQPLAIDVPWFSLVMIGAGAITAGVVAASYPAWRASRKPTLQSLAGTWQ